MKKLFIFIILIMVVSVFADVPARFSYYYDGDRTLDSLRLRTYDADENLLADTSWGTSGSADYDSDNDTLASGDYGYDVVNATGEYTLIYSEWWGNNDSGFAVDFPLYNVVDVVASVDTESIARSTWDNDIVAQALRTVNASVVALGPDIVTFVMRDTANDENVGGVSITIKKHTDTSNVATINVPEGGGIFQFGMTAPDTFLVVIEKFGYIWPAYDTLIVLGATADTIEGYALAPTASGTDKTCVVRVEVEDGAGQPISGIWITAQLRQSNLADSAGVGIREKEFNDSTNTNGYVDFGLIWSSYIVKITDSTTNIPWHISVRQGPSIDFIVPRVSTTTLNFFE